MGTQAVDQYSFLHFSAGVIAYFWNVPLIAWFIINLLFEAFENSAFGMGIIQKISFFPGGQSQADVPSNIVCDIIFCMLGWAAGYGVDYLGKKYKWYNM